MLDEIEKLVDLVTNSSVAELTVRVAGRRLTIRRSAAPIRPEPAPVTVAAPVEPISDAQAQAAPLDEPHWITAPMVGVFHHANPPMEPGVEVERGQVVGLIESMKLMNDIRAERAGVVSEVTVETGMAVEYGQPLVALA